MHNISIKKMSVFISAVETGSFTSGARRSNISQPAAVSIINELESTVGAELFVRHGKSRTAKPTPRGEEVYDTLVRALSTYQQALEAISISQKKRKEQVVLIQSPYAEAVSSNWLKSVRSICKDSHMSIRTAEWGNIINAIERREDCVALIDGDVRLRNREYVSLGVLEIGFAIPEANESYRVEGSHIDWEDVPKDTLVYTAISPRAVDGIYNNLELAGNAKDEFMEVNSARILHNFCSEIGSPMIVPKLVVDTVKCGQRIRYLSFSHSKINLPLGLSLPFGHMVRSKMTRSVLQQVLRERYLM
jgi:DNA-binding transcriptional LysR family regulator